MIDNEREKGGEITGIVAKVDTILFCLKLVLSTRNAIKNPIIVEAVAVETPNRNDPHRATIYDGERASAHLSKENTPSVMNDNLRASMSGKATKIATMINNARTMKPVTGSREKLMTHAISRKAIAESIAKVPISLP